MAAFASPPTAELHLHIEGTIEPAAIFRMAARNGLPAPAGSLEEFLSRYRFADLQSFLDLHYANLTVLRHEEDFYDLATGYLDRAAAANVRRAEIFFDPQTHQQRRPVGRRDGRAHRRARRIRTHPWYFD